MQATRGKAEALGRKAKLAHSYQELLDEFSNKDLKSVGNYTLGRLIGKGSFGKVYLASHKLINGTKVVLKSANKDDSNLAREIHHHRQFVHPHIARLYEVIVTESMVWLVLEYCSGDELYNYLLNHGSLPADKVQKIFAQLVGAVSYVHNQACVHRDLKLENILLDKNENVKLVDFGFTREYEGKASYLQTFCGTICYSAPEMLKGEKYAGEKVDVWSLGVILYALLCGELPFDDDDDNMTRKKILTQEPKYPDHLPPEAVPLLKSLLSKRPLLRPTLPDILSHPFLEEHAPTQQTILKMEQPSPFSTSLEKDVLERMRSAGVDIDTVIESVLSQRCDALAGWWTLLLEKEERKVRRRERKRREREAEHRSSRRLSAASSRLERLAPIADEDGTYGLSPHMMRMMGDSVRPRGRSERRSGHFADLIITDLPGLPELAFSADGGVSAGGLLSLSPDAEVPPPPIDKDSIRSASSSRHRRPIPPPKEGVLRSARSRGSTLHLVTTSEALGLNSPTTIQLQSVALNEKGHAHGTGGHKVRKKPSQAILAHWKTWTHWIVENTRRGKSANRKGSQSTPNLVDSSKPASGGAGGSAGLGASMGGSQAGSSTGKLTKDPGNRPHTSKYPGLGSGGGGSPGLAPPGGSSARAAAAAAAAAANGRAVHGMTLLPNGVGGALGSPGSTTLSTPGAAGGRVPSLGAGIGSSTSGPPSLYKRQSLSPSPLTPRSALRRSSAGGHSAAGAVSGLRGRKSTSSSVSSVRSMPRPGHHHSHSKASSTSSNGSVSTNMSKTPAGGHHGGRSPHHSVKVLPATPTNTTFPSNIRLVRGPVNLSLGGGSGGGFNEGMPAPPGSPNPFATGFAHRGHHGGEGGGGPSVLFAKRKRNIFKGPMLAFGNRGGGSGSGGGGVAPGGSRKDSGGSHSRSASAAGLGRRSGEITIQEEDEDGDEMASTIGGLGGPGSSRNGMDEDLEEDDEVEEVEAFSPVVRRPGEKVEERIFEEGEEEDDEVTNALGLRPSGGSSGIRGGKGKETTRMATVVVPVLSPSPAPVAGPRSPTAPIIRKPIAAVTSDSSTAQS